ncbi:bile salt-activated lipase-like isoform X2 [Danaus plexippus]|uniref:bile salt-activated lipase-like isoform X2 n=1 Tax=Danaus plexippus TaxID=13037 RepID=UPI002AB1C66D|nr:bile salt-activated lipase-like isoform X2 [Danaus plexippus]
MKWKNKLFLLTLIAIKLVDEPAPEVTIAQGTLIGKISSDGTFFEYLGIPYATTNSSTRFRAPGPPPSWTGLFKAVEESSSCPQNSFFGFIFTAEPSYLEVVEAPGNAGIKDQLAALRWVKKNIGAFGGDSNNITIMGESAGATSASLLLISDAAAGLFNRAIMQSGTSVSNWSINRNPVWVASLLAKSAGYETKNPKELYDIFSKMTYQELTALRAKKPLQLFFDTQLLHLPCVESTIAEEEPVITDLPFNLYKNISKDIDVIYGSTSKEGFLLIAGDTNETLAERHGRYLFASDLRFSSDEEGFVISKKVENFYFGDDIINMSQILKVAEFYTQLYFEIPAIFETECLIDKTQSKVYNYIFNYSGQRNFMKLRSGYYNEPGASHADDLFYLFRGSLIPPIFTKQDKKIIDYMTTLWTNFAKYGDPTPDWTNSVLKWEPSKKHNMKFLYIDDVPKIGSMPNNDAFHLWKNIYDKYRKTDI